MTTTDNNIRILMSIALFVWAFIAMSWMIALMGAALLYTVFTKHCFIYSFLGVNKNVQTHNQYLQALPLYNPEPVFIINDEAQILFRNEPAKQLFPQSINFDFLKDKEKLLHTIEQNKFFQVEHTFADKKTYTFVMQGAKKMNAIMAYGTNITDLIRANDEVMNIQKDVIYTMGAIGETRSKETGNHVKRVAMYSEILALKYGLPEEEAKLLKMASPMHDIGKVGIKDEILNKPAKLTDDEFKIMKTHSSLGYAMLKNSDKPILKAAAIVAHEHHEKYDGTGYPKKKKGEDIHIYGRITAIADVFDALGSDRVYKKAWPLEDIFELFKQERGKHFDPVLIDLFFEHFDEIDKVRLRYQDK
jgi:response regulator RpfG family c-di-GMP phosphodiesterase